MSDLASELPSELIATCRRMADMGLSHGTSGNVSVRLNADRFLVSPTGIAYDALTPDMIPDVALDGTWRGARAPSSEWRFHCDIYRARADVTAIVHTHSTYATGLACTGQGIPAFHYMVAVAGGGDIRCAPYATYGTQELSDYAVAALDGRKACLLANHGVIATGTSLSAALSLASEVENLAAQYAAARAAGTPQVLDVEEMERVIAKFATYGRQAR